jgi:DNA-binding transcriptional ArsR family regulator
MDSTTRHRRTARPRTPPEPTRAELQLVAIFAALADPLRLNMVRMLLESDGKPCKACACPKLAKSTVAYHFKILREAGILSSHAAGTEIINRVRSTDLKARFPGLLEAIIAGLDSPLSNAVSSS